MCILTVKRFPLPERRSNLHMICRCLFLLVWCACTCACLFIYGVPVCHYLCFVYVCACSPQQARLVRAGCGPATKLLWLHGQRRTRLSLRQATVKPNGYTTPARQHRLVPGKIWFVPVWWWLDNTCAGWQTRWWLCTYSACNVSQLMLAFRITWVTNYYAERDVVQWEPKARCTFKQNSSPIWPH